MLVFKPQLTVHLGKYANLFGHSVVRSSNSTICSLTRYWAHILLLNLYLENDTKSLVNFTCLGSYIFPINVSLLDLGSRRIINKIITDPSKPRPIDWMLKVFCKHWKWFKECIKSRTIVKMQNISGLTFRLLQNFYLLYEYNILDRLERWKSIQSRLQWKKDNTRRWHELLVYAPSSF